MSASNEPVRYRGRVFTTQHIRMIRNLITSFPEAPRSRLAHMVCERLDWRSADGRLKLMASRDAMLQMHRDGLIELPPPRADMSKRGRRAPRITARSQPCFPIAQPAGALRPLNLVIVKERSQSQLWNEYIERYHYLKYQPLVGAQLRYFVECSQGVLAALGFNSAAWKCRVRDQWIGWNATQREQRLHLIVNNARFLILPWVRSPHLASMILAAVCKQLPIHWRERYGYRPLLMETFVDSEQFKGTCYKAANWQRLGLTQGRGKYDFHTKRALPKKIVFAYPLHKTWKKHMTSESEPK